MSSRLLLLAPLVVAAGCGGGGTKTRVETGTAPAPARTPATTATTPTTTTPAAATTPKQNRHGKVGDTFVLVGSKYSHVAKGKTSGPRDKIAVRVTAIVDPITGYDVGKANRLVGVRKIIRNVGKVKYTDFQPSGDLTLKGGGAGKGESLISTGPETCKDPATKLAPGASGDVCMAFLVPKNAKLQSFQYTSDIGDGQSGLWKIGCKKGL